MNLSKTICTSPRRTLWEFEQNHKSLLNFIWILFILHTTCSCLLTCIYTNSFLYICIHIYTHMQTRSLKTLIEIKYLSVVKYCSADQVCVIQYYPNMICILLIYLFKRVCSRWGSCFPNILWKVCYIRIRLFIIYIIKPKLIYMT